jgi:hypothetical protein
MKCRESDLNRNGLPSDSALCLCSEGIRFNNQSSHRTSSMTSLMTFISKGKGHPMIFLCRHRGQAGLKIVPISHLILEKRMCSGPRSGRFILGYDPALYRRLRVRVPRTILDVSENLALNWDSIAGSSSPVRVTMPSTLSQPPFYQWPNIISGTAPSDVRQAFLGRCYYNFLVNRNSHFQSPLSKLCSWYSVVM